MTNIDFKLFNTQRTLLDISLKTAAKDIGISHTTLADLENGVKDRIHNERKWKATLKYAAKINKRANNYVRWWSSKTDVKLKGVANGKSIRKTVSSENAD